MSDDMQGRLQAYYAHAFPARQEVRVSDMVSISAGWESDIYSFAVEHGPAGERKSEELILCIYPGDDAHGKSASEFHGMSQLYKAGYPVPQVLWPLFFGASEGEKRWELLTPLIWAKTR